MAHGLQMALIIGLCGLYGYINGVHGSASVIATVITSRALPPRIALWFAALGIGLGPFLLGVAVANTLGTELMQPEAATVKLIAAALVGAIIWSGLNLWLGVPTSISQTLIGGVIGAALAALGAGGVHLAGLQKVIVALLISPVIGLSVAFVLVRITYRLTRHASPGINRWLKGLQILASFLVAISFGANNCQQLVAVLTLGLVAVGALESFSIPLWVIAYCTVVMTLGTLVGGQRMIRTLGSKFYHIRPIHGFGSQIASGFIILFAGLTGSPVSGSQIVTSAIIGSGSADRIQKVRWRTTQRIALGWLFTLPSSAAMAYVAYLFIDLATR